MLDVHGRDTLQNLIEKSVESTGDFEWTSQMRYTFALEDPSASNVVTDKDGEEPEDQAALRAASAGCLLPLPHPSRAVHHSTISVRSCVENSQIRSASAIKEVNASRICCAQGSPSNRAVVRNWLAARLIAELLRLRQSLHSFTVSTAPI